MPISLPVDEQLPSQDDLLLAGSSGRFNYPQDVMRIEMNEDGYVKVREHTYYTSSDGTPCSQWHGRYLVWTLPGGVDRDALVETLTEGGEIAGLLTRIHAGHEIVWDGSNNVGRLNADATEAMEQLDRALEGLQLDDSMAVWDATDWLLSQSSARALLADAGLTTTSIDEDVELAAKQMLANARADAVLIRGGQSAIETVLLEARKAVAAEDADID